MQVKGCFSKNYKFFDKYWHGKVVNRSCSERIYGVTSSYVIYSLTKNYFTRNWGHKYINNSAHFRLRFTRRQFGGPRLNKSKIGFNPDGILTATSFHWAPIAGSALCSDRRGKHFWVKISFTFCLVNLAALIGVARFVMGRD